jgi:hypothetical protein
MKRIKLKKMPPGYREEWFVKNLNKEFVVTDSPSYPKKYILWENGQPTSRLVNKELCEVLNEGIE